MLEGALTVPVIPWDERLTSKSAEDMLIEANVVARKEGALWIEWPPPFFCKATWNRLPAIRTRRPGCSTR